jgi:3-hydroxyisobutyrate dehydrogenase/2-hydroxy-3-oxopropionate reductase
MAVQVGFIGLGKMGKPMSRRLLAAGFGVYVFNRSRGPTQELAAEGARAAASAREVAERAEIVLTCLPLPDSVEAVYGELAPAARAGQLFVDHSTISVRQSKHLAELLRARGAAFLDAPISGGPAGAQAGTLTVMVGGDQASYDRALPVFNAFGKNIRLCGGAGAGQVVKLVNQLLVGIHAAAIMEAAVFGTKLGADPQVLLEIIGTSFGGSTMMTRNLPRFMSRDFAPASPVSLVAKDLGIIHDEAKAAGTPLFLGAIAEQRFLEARARGMGDQDMAAAVQLWEEAAGIRVIR